MSSHRKKIDDFYDQKINNLQKILDDSRANPPKLKPISFQGFWKGYHQGTEKDIWKPVNTKIAKKTLVEIGEKLTNFPENFNLHPKLKRLVENRQKMIRDEQPIDWGMAELLAYGSLLKEGTPCRLSGQDSVRGTFSHRHSCFYDYKTGEKYNPLITIDPGKNRILCL